jgi:RNA polymerase sigma-70 factor (ECF subfamily)
MVWAREDARDIISETILIACENFEKLRNKEAFVYYLFGIASRLIKRRSSTKDRYQNLDEEGWDRLGQFSTIEHSDDCEDLYRMLNGLPVKYRESLVLFEIAGFSINEITGLQGGTISGVKSRLVRARKMLTEVYEKEKAVLK